MALTTPSEVRSHMAAAEYPSRLEARPGGLADLAELERAKAAWLEAAHAEGKPIPVPVTVRRSTELHEGLKGP